MNAARKTIAFIGVGDYATSGIFNLFLEYERILARDYDIVWFVQDDKAAHYIKSKKIYIVHDLSERNLALKDFILISNTIRKERIKIVLYAFSFIQKKILLLKLLNPKVKIVYQEGMDTLRLFDNIMSYLGKIIISGNFVLKNSMTFSKEKGKAFWVLQKAIPLNLKNIMIYNFTLLFIKKTAALTAKPMPMKPDKVTLGYMGRFDIWQKNNLVILRALKMLLEMGYDARVIMMGACFKEEDEDAIKNKIKELNIDKHVQFLPASHDEDDKRRFFDNIDIFVLTSRREGGPIVFAEALDYNKHIIATNVGVLPEMAKEGVRFLSIDQNSPRDLADKVQMLIKDKELQMSMYKANMEFIKNIDITSYEGRLIEMFKAF